jgi:opacity protein-like surface antigen
MSWSGAGKRRKWGLGFLVILLTVGFLLPAPTPVLAVNTNLAIGCTILGVLGTAAIGYGIWENLPRNRGKERWLNGEFYVGGFLGAAFTPNQDLRYKSFVGAGGGAVTLFGNQFNTSLTGGVKFGYFTHSIPYLGLEVESSVNNSYVNRRTLSIDRPIQGATQATVPNDFWMNWSTALHIVGRYGFFKDKMAPFGRLQPYVGIGPAFIVLYEEVDSAKNFGVDVMAGVRYMLAEHLSAFVEYKFNYQWDVEIGDHPFYLPNGTVCRGMAYLDFACHKVVLGLAYHF